MPKIQISESLLYNKLNTPLNAQELEDILTTAKAEIDEPADENGNIKVELNDTNRPDLWSTLGLARHLNTYLETITPQELLKKYSFFNEDADPHKKIIVDPALQHIRPYVCGFIAKGQTVDEDILAELIQTQEKICHNFGQKRLAIAMGIYREDIIEWPIQYRAADPDSCSFTPLDHTAPLSLRNILANHPKGKEFGHIIEHFDKFPLLVDTQNNVLSMPPIINSAHLGAVQAGNNQLFIECTSINLEQLLLVVNILACDYKDLGFEITRVTTEYPYDIAYTPPANTNFIVNTNDITQVTSLAQFQPPLQVSLSSITKILGKSVSTDTITHALQKMGVYLNNIEKSHITVQAPVYRNDFLHEVDVIEDIIIGIGMEHLQAEYPQSFTIGRLSPIEQISRKIIHTMVGLGFQEMLFPYLGSRADFIEKMYDSSEWDSIQHTMIQLENPLSENYEFVRASILPNLLEVERVSANSIYPHRICEIGKVVHKDEHNNYGSRTDTVLGLLIADSTIGYTDINSIMAVLCYYHNIEWETAPLVDSRFIEGRAAKLLIRHNNTLQQIGYFGEIHPRVLEAYNIHMPCVGGEITLELLV